jgi:hypothetical protein
MSAGLDPRELDELQARLVERLRAAGGEPVSFDELRAIGIENPALLCYELAAVGLPVTRTCSPGEGMPALSVRLEPRREEQPDAAATGDSPREPELEAPGAPGSHPGSPQGPGVGARAMHASAATALGRLAMLAGRLGTEHRLRPSRLIAVSALAIVTVAIVAMALGAQGRTVRTESGGARADASRPAPATVARQSPRASPPPAAATAPAPPAQSIGQPQAGEPASPVRAAALEAVGHRLLGEGSYAGAIPQLLAAVRTSGGSLAGCREPASDGCLTFAYALYDLGRALRLQGRHPEAITVLSQRLQIDNQRPVVQRELALARSSSS